MDALDDIGRFCVYDAPMALDPDLLHTNGLDPRVAGARNKRQLSNLRKCIAGPLPVDVFVEGVVGQTQVSDRSSFLSPKNAFRSVPPTADTPEQIYEPLLVALNKQTKHKSRCPGFVFQNTARRSLHPNHLGYAKPHISCYTRRNVQKTQQLSRSSRSELGYAELFIQVIANATHDFFVDPPPELDAKQRASFDCFSLCHHWYHDPMTRGEVEDALGLHVAFVTEIFARQHRNAYYSVSMAGSRARLFRWDRAGCVVSESFDIRERPEPLCEFLWRFSQTTDASRGHDCTVSPATLEQELRFRDAVKDHVRSQLEVEGEALDKALSQHYSPGHAAIVKVYPHRQPLSHTNVWRFIVSRPVVSSLTLVGRGTRGYWAVETTTSRVVFLKDTWHIGSDGAVEGDLLIHLNRLGACNVPSLVAHGDVPDFVPTERHNTTVWQKTMTARIAEQVPTCRVSGEPVSTTDVQRYRLAMGTVGYGLSTLKGTEELLHATYDAFTTMRDVLAKDSRIHRDISVGNIILVKVPGQEIRRGYLIDWETSVRVDDAGRALHSGRVGTWYFMSWRLLQLTEEDEEEEDKQTFRDDMESLIHVVLYCALLYLPHKLARDALVRTIEDYFERVNGSALTTPRGGDAKLLAVFNKKFIEDAGFGSTAVVEWLTTMLTFQRADGKTFALYGEHWTPEHVDAFWSDFLKTRELERDNHTAHDVTKTRYYNFTALSTPAPSVSPTPTRKRSAEGDLVGDVPAPKRRRSMRLQAVHATTSSPAPAAPHRTDGPRRSQRVKTISARAQAPSAAPSTTAPHATRTATRRTTRGRGRGRPRR